MKTTIKTKSYIKNIWVYHRKDGYTTFGKYIAIKHDVFLDIFLELKELNEAGASKLAHNYMLPLIHRIPNIRFCFKGDHLPHSFLDALRIKEIVC